MLFGGQFHGKLFLLGGQTGGKLGILPLEVLDPEHFLIQSGSQLDTVVGLGLGHGVLVLGGEVGFGKLDVGIGVGLGLVQRGQGHLVGGAAGQLGLGCGTGGQPGCCCALVKGLLGKGVLGGGLIAGGVVGVGKLGLLGVVGVETVLVVVVELGQLGLLLDGAQSPQVRSVPHNKYNAPPFHLAGVGVRYCFSF